MSGHQSQTAPSRELLLANHRFPGSYVVKAFGPSSPAFTDAIEAAALAVVGETRANVLRRTSRRGNKVCVTLILNVFTVDEVIDIYERIHRVPQLRMIL